MAIEEAARGKMASHGQCAETRGERALARRRGTAGSRADAGCGHRDVYPWRLGRQRHVQSRRQGG